jgi:hypothetical protein
MGEFRLRFFFMRSLRQYGDKFNNRVSSRLLFLLESSLGGKRRRWSTAIKRG